MSVHTVTELRTVSPTSGETLRTYDPMTDAEVDHIVSRAQEEHERWRGRSFAERARPMRTAATLLRDRAEEYARLMAVEMGKPLREGRSEAEKCAWVCDFYAEHAERFLADEPIATDASRSFVAHEPLGVVLAIMPWNFPFWQVMRFAAPALMAGNGAVLKHAPNVTGCGLAIESLMRDAGFPEDLFRTIVIETSQARAVIEHPGIAAVTLTGSTGAGRAVAAQAGAVLKKTVLELGGSDAYLILADADLDLAAEQCVTSRLINGGQSCIAAKRFIVVPDAYGPFLDRLVELMGSKSMGDPLEETTDIGPQARFDLRDALHEQVRRSIDCGARCRLGGEVPQGPGAFYPPTVLTDVAPGMPAWDEELFGPVATVIAAKDEVDAVRIANDTPYGLGAAVFTRDVERGTRIATHELSAGACFVNSFVRSDPRLPFGGIKMSGYGRELGEHGIREFVNIKTVYVR